MLLILSASILTMTTSRSEMVSGIEGLLRPLRIIRIPSQDIAIMVSIALRFMPTLLEEIDRIREAQMARGAKLKTGTLVQRVKATTFLLIPIIQSCFHRAEALATAMQSRCYKRGPRTYMNELRISWKDCLYMGVIILIAGLYSLKSHMASLLFKIGFLF
jgi:energy-coupling factor transport system permease protein